MDADQQVPASEHDDRHLLASDAHRRERVREGVTMALYISLSLLAVMLALPKNIGPSAAESPATAVFLTSVGLILAHQLAYRLSARLAHHGRLHATHLDLLAAQLAGGFAVTGVAVVPLLLIEGRAGVVVSELVLITFIAGAAYTAARMVPYSRLRSLGFTGGIVVLALAVLWVKNLVGH